MKKMLKKAMALLLTVMMIITAVPMTASAKGTYGKLYYEIIDDEVTIIDCEPSANFVTIPAEIDGYPVTSIGNNAFFLCVMLREVNIPASVKSIGAGAFSWSQIESITIPDSVTSIDESAFNACPYLTNITVDENNKNYSSDENGVLFNKEKSILLRYPIANEITSYVIPDSVTSIGDDAFRECTSLTSITIPDGVTSIGNDAFSGCSSLASITIPDGVTSIGNDAFHNCTSLTSITIPDGVTSIGFSALSGCSSLTNITVDENNNYYSADEYGVLFNKNKTALMAYPAGNTNSAYVIPDSVISIGDDAFNGCSSLTSITIPDSVTSIGDDAFRECTSLTSITIPDGVTSIGNDAFLNCTSLTSITIPDSVTSIGSSAFSGCSSLTSITIPDGVTSIGNDAFLNCTSLTSITIPDSVTSIGDDAFRKCTSLTSITIPDGVTSIGDWAFGYCTALKDLTVPVSVTSIGSSAFSGCSSLASITIPDSVTSIGSSAFRECTSLTSITIPDSVTRIGSSAFSGCSSLTSITIPDSVTSIDNYAFYNCKSLDSITINNPECEIFDSENTFYTGATIYGYKGSTAEAYAEKYDREFVALKDNSEEILNALSYEIVDGEVIITGCDESFSGKMEIPSIIEGYPVTTIGDGAFYMCTEITSVTIPDSVTSFGLSAFYWCASLRSITIPAGVTSIGDFAFGYCYALKNITIPAGVTSIGEYVFHCCESLESITVDENNENYSNDEYGVLFNKDKTQLVQYPIGNERTEYVVPDSVVSIACDSFFFCADLSNITIGNSVTSIGDWAFGYCTALKDLTVPVSVTSIGDGAFLDCESLTGIIILNPECEICDSADVVYPGATIYGYEGSTAQAYAQKYDRTFVVIEESDEILNALSYEIIDGEVTITDCDENFSGEMIIPARIKGYPVTSIDPFAFAWCSLITSITISDSVTSIGYNAFSGCESLETVIISDSVIDIGVHAFVWCTALKNIIVDKNNEYYSSDEYSVLFNKDKTHLIQYPGGKQNTEYVIPDSVVIIGDEAFHTCTSLADVTIPDSVTTIRDAAFAYCYSIADITIPDTVTSIGEGAFWSCESLTNITIPASVNSLSDNVFYDCESLESITILNPECEICDSADVVYPGATIYGYEGSTAQAYAEKYGREFVALDKECEHNYVEVITTPATCTEKGEKTFTCSECGDVKTEEIEELGHDWNEITASYKVCNRCGETDGVLAYDTTVTVSNVTGRPGETVEVYVSFGKDTDVKTMSISEIVYDSDKLTLVKGEWLADGSVIDDWNLDAQVGVITFKENTTLSGNVFVLTFKIKDELEDCEVVIDCDFGIKAMNENNVETALAVEVVPGSVTITNIIKGDVNGDDYVDSNDAIHLLYHTMLPDRYEINQDCDFDGNGYVDSNDSIYLLYHTMLPDRYPLS